MLGLLGLLRIGYNMDEGLRVMKITMLSPKHEYSSESQESVIYAIEFTNGN